MSSTTPDATRRLIPHPATVNLDGRWRSVLTPLSIAGPEWTSDVLQALPNHFPFPTVESAGPADAIVRVDAPHGQDLLVPRELPDASYTLEVTEESVTVTCAEPAGLVSALRAVGALIDDGLLPCGTITDSPRFSYRGVHLDVCRHFFGVEFVRRYLGTLASLGMNVFHWHLTEDQGWRFPVPAWPRLTEIGGYRDEKDGSYGGSYSREEIASVVEHAGRLGILVIPEIEMPGHAQAAVAAYPDLSCTGEKVNVWTEWGISKHVFCAGNDRVFQLIGDTFDEVVRLFPSRYVHIGGDECPKDHWNECPQCRARMKQEGLADTDELQSYFVGRAARMLEERGRVAIGWDEILEGGLPHGTTVMSWRGVEGGRSAAAAGHMAIMTPLTHCYFNMEYRKDLFFGAAVPFDRVYEFDPTSGLTKDDARNILGGQACLWTELIESEKEAERMLMPRLLAISEVLWREGDRDPFDRFLGRARLWLDRFAESGWHTNPLDESLSVQAVE